MNVDIITVFCFNYPPIYLYFFQDFKIFFPAYTHRFQIIFDDFHIDFTIFRDAHRPFTIGTSQYVMRPFIKESITVCRNAKCSSPGSLINSSSLFTVNIP